MTHGLPWGGNRGKKKGEPLPVSEYRELFPKYSWAVINDTSEVEQVMRAYQAMTHPLTKTFVDCVLTNHIPSPKKRLLLILPCSRAKPYSMSFSYLSVYRPLVFLFAGRDIKDEKCPIDVLVTSGMIGPVPLELEEYSPAPNYDFSLNSIVDISGATDLFQLLAQRMSKYLKRVLVFYEGVYSLVNKAYKSVIELALKRIQIQNNDMLKKIHFFPISSSNLPAMVEVMIRLRNKLYPNDKNPQEVINRRYFETLKTRLKIASKIICELDSRIFC
jgi:predicted RNA-binding protein